MSSKVNQLLRKAVEGQRLTSGEGLFLLEEADVLSLGRAAREVSLRRHPEGYRTYNIDRNINYSNVCAAVCDFCAFYRKKNDEDAYVLDRETLYQKFDELIAIGGEQVLMQGGLHPDLKLEWYEDLLRDLKTRYPSVNLHAFSPPEIWFFHKLNKIPLRDVLVRLKEAGLGSIPGGGGEILVDRVRSEITRGKCMTDEWLEVMRVAHQIGLRSTATMMFGHIETLAERIEHLDRVRQLQDETGGFTAFICWTFQPEHTDMADVPPVGPFEYLKTQAVSRIYLDNVENVQSSWVTQGQKIGQLGLLFGANDMGSLMLEENVVSAAGTTHQLTLDQIRSSIAELGYTPRQRNVFYELVPEEEEVVLKEPPSNALPIVG
ncbi:Aminodeoxyfutalosine synthase [Planctomycetes bacterium Pan216]|uniref:Cyclic dehypoxanthine futalosine synthase n=1 Tax=Kolteria novifilia TaxID=2527975 RepID=A0A518AY35_9BACT|nr:Aminodeoxyfutalosine synthase [Planctomycetes bacterium Pan216]